MPRSHCLLTTLIILFTAGGIPVLAADTGDWMPDLARIKPDVGNGIQNAGWAYDRYKGQIPTLDAHTEITLADIEGPAVIKHIHILRHNPVELMTRGLVLKIYFDHSKEPAVLCPLGDFFGIGSNGRSRFFSSLLTEYAPQTQNAYFPMPFKEHAKVVLENQTDINTASYSFVEWEKLPKWDEEMGYFHATFKRQCFQLLQDSNVTLFEIEGKGHLVGRQFSFASDEPMIQMGGTYWGEGNNEVDIDGVERAVEYLGFEDSFNLSWGWGCHFFGLRNATTCWDEVDKPQSIKLLSFFCFHDDKPIRFNKSLCWRVNWTNDIFGKEFSDESKKGGFWVDFATVHYWYQDNPAGYQHDLPPLTIRTADLLRSSLPEYAAKPRMVKEGGGNETNLLIPGGEEYDAWFKKQGE